MSFAGGFKRVRGAGSRDGYAVAYPSAFGHQLLIDGEGKVVIFTKKHVYASAHGGKHAYGEPRRVYEAMSSPAWGRL